MLIHASKGLFASYTPTYSLIIASTYFNEREKESNLLFHLIRVLSKSFDPFYSSWFNISISSHSEGSFLPHNSFCETRLQLSSACALSRTSQTRASFRRATWLMQGDKFTKDEELSSWRATSHTSRWTVEQRYTTELDRASSFSV